MIKTINVILIALMLGGAGFVYLMKYDSERAAGRISKLQRDIADKRHEITTLRAEWSVLNQPRRVQELVEKYRSYLELDTLDPTQVASIDDIPMRPSGKTDATAPDPAKPASRMLAIGKPTDLTGSLVKKPADGRKTTDKTVPLASPKTIDPNPNDPINALIR